MARPVSDLTGMAVDGGGWRRPVGRALGVASVVVAVVLSGVVLRRTYVHPRTDDAAVRANLVGVAPHVSGPIVELPIADNQRVRAGDLLFVVDPRPYEATLAAARAGLDVAEFELLAGHRAVAAAEADVAAREAEAAYAADYRRRVEPLLSRQFVTADRVADARAKEQAAAAAVARATQERDRARDLLAQAEGSNARVEAARAAVRRAELDVGYCRVVAPFDGWVTDLNIAVGQYARAGDPVVSLVDDREWYVIANFRETFLESIRPGMAVQVYLLSYPDRPFRGVVQGIGWAVLSNDGVTVGGLPAVRRTLDWVRLAQRFPVRILLTERDAERPFRMGASAVVTVRGE